MSISLGPRQLSLLIELVGKFPATRATRPTARELRAAHAHGFTHATRDPLAKHAHPTAHGYAGRFLLSGQISRDKPSYFADFSASSPEFMG